MQQISPENQTPLVVDLDGTLIKGDMLWEYIVRLLCKNPFSIFQILFWWSKGRANLKRKLSVRFKIDPATLKFNNVFLAWLREQKASGRKVILATASDLHMAKPVADFVGVFDEVLASDGKTNLRAGNKLKALVEKYGEHKFDYAGNSPDDLAVWRGAREAIVVNASQEVQQEAAKIVKVSATFPENYSRYFISINFLNELFLRSGYLLAIITGFLLALALPKTEVAGFAWIAPAILIFAARGKNSADAFRVGYVGGIVFWLTSLYWLLLMPAPFFAFLGWIALCAFLALFFGAWTCLMSGKISEGNWAQRNLGSLLGAAVWVGLEMIRARIFGGFPWNFIGASQFNLTPLIQIASVTGVYGVSFLVVWTSLSFYSAALMIARNPKSRFTWQADAFVPLLVVVGFFFYGELKLEQPAPTTKTLRITLIQPSVPQTLIWDEKENANRFQQLLALSENALKDKPDVLVWPESAVPELSSENYRAITNLVRTHHIWIIFNAEDVLTKINAKSDEDYDYFNAAFLFAPNGECAGIYHKQKLVMFGEYIPIARWIPFLKNLPLVAASFSAGNFPVPFQMQNLEANTSPLICFEDVFPQLARKSVQGDTDFLINLTNDGWFGKSAEQWQHMANAVFRAVENDVPLVRCANNGITCWIDPHGRVKEKFAEANGGVYATGFMTVELPLQKHTQTFYNRYGDWFGWICVGTTTLITFTKIRRRFFKRKPVGDK